MFFNKNLLKNDNGYAIDSDTPVCQPERRLIMHTISQVQNPEMSEAKAVTDPRKKRKLLIWRIIVFILPILVLFGAIAGFAAMGALKPKPEEKEDVVKAIPVLTAKAISDDVTLTVKAQGEVQPRTQINIVPQISGRVTYLSPKFIEGGKFSKGERLLAIEPAEFELRVVQARANVAQAETALARERSEADIARQDWADIGRGGEATDLTLRKPQMAEVQAQLEAAKAQLAEAELQLTRTVIYAPFNGRVIQRNIDQGGFVSTGMVLGEVYAEDIMDVRLPLTHNELRQIGLTVGYHAGQSGGIPVILSGNVAGRYSEWSGHIMRTDSRFDSQSRVLYAYAEVHDPFGKGSDNGTPMAPGLFVEAAIEGEKLTDVVIIPRAALRGEDKIYRAKPDGTLTIETVTVMSSTRERAVLDGGINFGDAVITSPIRGVAEGMKIEVVKPGDAGAQTLSVGEKP